MRQYVEEDTPHRDAPDDTSRIAELNQKSWDDNLRDPILAGEFAAEALELAVSIGDKRGEIFARLNLAWSRFFLSDYRRAQEDLDLALADIENDRRLERTAPELACKVLNASGVVLHRLSDFPGAIERYQESISLAERYGLTERTIAALNNIGEVELDLRRYAVAKEFFLRAQDLINSSDSSDTELDVQRNLGEIAFHAGDIQTAERHYNRALELTAERDDRVNRGEVFARLGVLESHRGDRGKAEWYYIQSMRIAREIQSPALRCSTLMRLGDLHGQSNDCDDDMAVEFYRQGLEIANEIESRYFQYRLYKRLADIHESADRYAEALQSYKWYMELKTEIVSESAEYRLEQISKRAEVERLRLEHQRLETVSRVAREITSKLDLDEIFHSMYDQINTILDGEVMGLALYDEASDTITYRLILEKGNHLEPIVFDVGNRSSVAAWVVRNRQEVVIDDLHGQYRQYIDELPDSAKEINHSAIYLPLEINDRIVGVLSVQTSRPSAYTEIDVRTIRTLAGFVAIAVDNALTVDRVHVINQSVQERNDELQRAYRHISEVANRDDLTGLSNRRMFTEMLTAQLENATKGKTKIGVVFVDLDRFKPVNDRYGHAVGDEVLKVIGARLNAAVRGRDVVARLGGDEFAIILPDVSEREDVEMIAEKIATTIALEIDVPGEGISGRCIVNVSASTGIALFPDDGTTYQELLDRADKEMYGDKRSRG